MCVCRCECVCVDVDVFERWKKQSGNRREEATKREIPAWFCVIAQQEFAYSNINSEHQSVKSLLLFGLY